MGILSFGSMNIDLVFSVSHVVRAGETIPSHAFRRSAGGKGANQAAALAKAGLEVFHAGRIGCDGRFLVSLLQEYGVHTDFILEDDQATGQAIIQIDAEGQNSIVLYQGANRRVSHEDIEQTLAHFSSGDVLVAQNEISGMDYLLKRAKEKGMVVWFNVAPFDSSVFQLPLQDVDMIIVNETEGAQLARLPLDTPFTVLVDALVASFPNSEIVLTAGKGGAYYGFGDKREKCDIVKVPVVDTTGAGDTFIGYLLAARLRGYTVAGCLALACKAAALKVSRSGACEAMPFANEVFQ
ncbi:MAG: PfkB family carbohydrate kinase [Sphaerochaetaceae bacterium]